MKTEKEKENLEKEKEAKIGVIDKLAEEVKKRANTRNRSIKMFSALFISLLLVLFIHRKLLFWALKKVL